MEEIITNLSLSIHQSNNILYQFWSSELLNELKYGTKISLADRKYLFELLYYCNSEIGTRIMSKLNKDFDIQGLELDYSVITYKNKNLYKRQLGLLSNRFFKMPLDEFAPFLNIYDLPLFVEDIYKLAIILPSNDPSWKDFMVALWSVCNNCSNLDALYFDLLARLATECCSCFNEGDISLVFNRGFRWLNLKVGKPASGNVLIDVKVKISGDFNVSKEDAFAKFIAYCLDVGSVRQKIHELLLAVEVFVHPSNSGPWTMALSNLVERLAFYLHERIIVKKNETNVMELCHSLYNLVLKMLHSKNVFSVLKAQVSLKYLSLLNSKISALFVETSLLAIESNDALRINSCIGALGAIAHTLCDQNVLDLLLLTLPGIDFNDIPKTFACAMFILTISSKIIFSDQGIESSVNFGYWLELYIDRIFSLFWNLPANLGGGHSDSEEEGVLQLVSMATKIIFEQLSPELEEMALNILFQKVFNHVNEPGIKIVAEICGLICFSRPKLRLERFVPRLIKQIEFEMDHGASSNSSDKKTEHHPHGMESMSDSSFHWYQATLISVISLGGADLLPFEANLLSLFEKMILGCNSYVAYVWTADLIQCYLTALLHRYPRSYKSHPAAVFYANEFQSDPRKHWGKVYDRDDIDIEWHEPSNLEKAAGFRALKRLTLLCIDRLDIKTSVKWLSILEKLIAVSKIVLQPRSELVGTNYDDDDNVMFFGCRPEFFGTSEYFHYCKGDEEYDEWIHIINTIQKKILNLNSLLTDSESIDIKIIMAKNIEQLLGSVNLIGQNNIGSGKILKMALRAGKQQILPRCALVIKEHELYLKRLQNFMGYNEIRSDLASELIDLVFEQCLSEYSTLSKNSQRVLVKILKCQSKFQIKIFYKILKVVHSYQDPSDDDKLLGALGLVAQRFMGPLHITFLRKLLESLSRIKLKPNILAMVTRIGHLVVQPTELKVLPPYNEKAISIAHSRILNNDVINRKIIISRRSIAEKEYGFVIDLVIRLCNAGTCSWRYLEILLKVLLKISSVTVPVRIELVNLLLKLVLDDLPNIRIISMKLLAVFFRFANIQGKKLHDIDSLRLKATSNDIIFNDLLNSFDFTANASSYFVDRQDCWYLYRPKEIRYYNRSLPDYLSGPVQDQVANITSGAEFWLKLIADSQHDTQVSVSIARCSFYRKLFRITKSAPLEVLLPLLRSLLSKVDDSSAQKTACEILGGIVRGLNNWNDNNLDQSILLMIVQGVQSSTTETIFHWSQCLAYIFTKIDPNRVKALIFSFITVDTNSFGSSFFADRKRIQMLSLIVNRFNFRLRNFSEDLVGKIVPLASSPFQEVRKAIAQFLAATLNVDWNFQITSWKQMLPKYFPVSKDNTAIKSLMNQDMATSLYDFKIINSRKTGK